MNSSVRTLIFEFMLLFTRIWSEVGSNYYFVGLCYNKVFSPWSMLQVINVNTFYYDAAPKSFLLQKCIDDQFYNPWELLTSLSNSLSLDRLLSVGQCWSVGSTSGSSSAGWKSSKLTSTRSRLRRRRSIFCKFWRKPEKDYGWKLNQLSNIKNQYRDIYLNKTHSFLFVC